MLRSVAVLSSLTNQQNRQSGGEREKLSAGRGGGVPRRGRTCTYSGSDIYRSPRVEQVMEVSYNIEFQFFSTKHYIVIVKISLSQNRLNIIQNHRVFGARITARSARACSSWLSLVVDLLCLVYCAAAAARSHSLYVA